MAPDSIIHRLLLIGYWWSPTESTERPRGWPDPRDLTGAWNTDDRFATLAHLRSGKVFRIFAGTSRCRICGCSLGSRELSDGVWAWPDGLDHYIEMHNIRLPEAFVAASRRSEASIPSWLASLEAELWLQSGGSATPVSLAAERIWVVDDSTWLDWAAANTPAHPAEDAVSLDEARELCRHLSHLTWSCEIDDVMGRWLLRIQADTQTERIYVQKCSAAVLERRLLSMRIPDASRIVDPEQAESIAVEYDGAWGAARVVAAHPQAWLVWVKRPSGDWPTEDQLNKILDTDQRFGWATRTIPTTAANRFLRHPATSLRGAGYLAVNVRKRKKGSKRSPWVLTLDAQLT